MADTTPTLREAAQQALETYLKECDDFAIVPDVGGAWAAAWRAARAENTTPTLREAAQQALEAIEPVMAYGRFGTRDVEQAVLQKAHAALRAALAEQAAECEELRIVAENTVSLLEHLTGSVHLSARNHVMCERVLAQAREVVGAARAAKEQSK